MLSRVRSIKTICASRTNTKQRERRKSDFRRATSEATWLGGATKSRKREGMSAFEREKTRVGGRGGGLQCLRIPFDPFSPS